MHSLIEFIVDQIQLQKRCGTQTVYEDCDLVPFLQFHLRLKFAVHPLYHIAAGHHFRPFDTRFSMESHAKFHLIIGNFKRRLLIPRQCAR